MREQIRIQKKIKRQQEVRKQIFILIVTACLILMLAVVFGSFLSKANTPSEQSKVAFKYFKSVMIEYGDTLSSIGEQYQDAGYLSDDQYLNEVIRINALQSDQIHAGEYLVLPYYSNTFK